MASDLELLRQLVEALDRRVPRPGAPGEIQIAKDSAALRQEALRKIAQLSIGPGGVAKRESG